MYSPAAGDAGECGFSTLLPREALMPGNGQWQFFFIILAASGMGFSSGRMQSSLAVSFACDGESFFFLLEFFVFNVCACRVDQQFSSHAILKIE